MLTESAFSSFVQAFFGDPEEVNSDVGSNCLRDEQSISRENERDSPRTRRLRMHVIGAHDYKVVIQTEQ